MSAPVAVQQITQIPTSFTDFTMFAGNIPPPTGVYIASDGLEMWMFKGGNTQWQQVSLISS